MRALAVRSAPRERGSRWELAAERIARPSADRGRLLGWIGGLSGVLIGFLATQLAWSWPSDIFGLGLRWVDAFTVGYALMVAGATYAQKAEGDGRAVRVVARTRLDRAAAVVLAVVGVLVSGSTVVFIAAKAGILAGAEGKHMAGDYWWFVMSSASQW